MGILEGGMSLWRTNTSVSLTFLIADFVEQYYPFVDFSAGGGATAPPGSDQGGIQGVAAEAA